MFAKQKKFTLASFPRATNATFDDSRLQVVYNLYEPTKYSLHDKRCVVNYVFLHGTGMTKSIWEYYIEKLYEHSYENLQENRAEWVVGRCIAVDQATTCDSALLNAGKLGTGYSWVDGAKDVQMVLAAENLPGFLVAVGHSLGGFQSLALGVMYPTLFDLIVAIEPVTISRALAISPGLFTALSSKIKDEFSCIEAFNKHFEKESFYNKCHPRILKDMKNDELILRSDGTVTVKTTKKQQMAMYAAMGTSAPQIIRNLDLIKSPVVHITGAAATWVPPEGVNIVREKIKNCVGVDIPGGEHLVNMDEPDKVLAVIKQHSSRIFSGKKISSLVIDKEKAFDEQYYKIFPFFRARL